MGSIAFLERRKRFLENAFGPAAFLEVAALFGFTVNYLDANYFSNCSENMVFRKNTWYRAQDPRNRQVSDARR